MVSYWKMDEASGSRADSHGSNNLTDVNTVTQSAGIINDSAQFTAANTEYLDIADNASLSLEGTSWTMWCWFYPDTNKSYHALGSKYGPGGNSDHEFIIFNDVSNRLDFDIYNASGGFTTLLTPNNEITLTAWNFVVWWIDIDAGTMNIQVNNGTVRSRSTTVSIEATSAPFRIGGNPATGAAFYANGRIDEFGFSKRVYTADERTQLYGAGSGLAYPFS